MRLLPNALTLPLLVYLYRPLLRYFPAMDKDRYARRVVAAANDYFNNRFRAVPFAERMLFLPYCLRPRGCPTVIDKQEGMQCPAECDIPCKLRETRELAMELGYRDARIVVSGRIHRQEGMLRSRDFLLRQIELLRPRAVIGCLCTNDLCQKYLHPDNLSPDGTLGKHGLKVIPHIVLLDSPNCRQSTVDWQILTETIAARPAH